MRLGTILRNLMNEKKLTSNRLAEKVNIPEGTLKTWLAGSAPRSLADVRKVARYLKVSFEYLCFGDEALRVPADLSSRGSPVEIFLKLTIVETDKKDTNESQQPVQDIQIKKARN